MEAKAYPALYFYGDNLSAIFGIKKEIFKYTMTPKIKQIKFFSVLVVFLACISPSCFGQINGSPTNGIAYEYLSNQRIKPDPKAEVYSKLSETTLSLDTIFNGEKRDTKSIVVTGIDITLDATSNDFHNIYEKIVGDRTNPRKDIEQLKLIADRITIIGEVRFPQTNVSINARVLNFEDRDGLVAKISTTPYPYKDKATGATQNTAASNGEKGMQAGNITVKVRDILVRFNEITDSKIRFVLEGGIGQEPGEGIPGNPGKDIPPFQKPTNAFGNVMWNVCDLVGNFQTPQYRNIDCNKVINIKNPKISWANQGSQSWPGDGTDAKPAGKPGIGGKGGILRISNENQNDIAYNIKGGASGPLGTDQEGGRGGFPNPAYRVCHNGPGVIDVCAVHNSKKGNDAIAPQPDAPFAEAGAFVILEKHEWLTKELVDLLILFADDLYKSGYDAACKELYLKLYNEIEYHRSVNSVYTTNWPLHYTAAVSRANRMINQINNDINYFKKSKGWVPTLSFELMKKAYSNGIDAALNELFFYYQINSRVKNNEAYKAQLSIQSSKEINTIKELEGSIARNISRTKELDLLIAPTKDSLDVFKELIQNEIDRLYVIAQNNVNDRQREDNLIASLKKLGQYVKLGALIYTGGQNVGQLGLISSLEEIYSNISGLNDDSEWKESEQTIAKLKALSGNLSDISKMVDNLKLKKGPTQEEIAQELKFLLESSDYYKGLVATAERLIKTSENLNDELGVLIINIQELIEELSVSVQNKAILEDKSISAIRYSNKNTIDVIEKRKKETEERLLYYQYYLLRSFEYEFLNTYTTSFTLNRTYDEFERIISTNPDSDQYVELTLENMQSLKTIFESDINKVVELALADINVTGDRPAAFTGYKLSKKELRKLEAGEKITINPYFENILPKNEQMQRVINISIPKLKIKTNDDYGVIRISIKHNGYSYLKKGNKTYLFSHGDGKTSPFQWTFSYTSTDDGNLPSTSITTSSLLKSLIYVDGTEENIDDLRKFSLPGCISDFQIEVSAQNNIIKDIKKLYLLIEYEYEEKE